MSTRPVPQDPGVKQSIHQLMVRRRRLIGHKTKGYARILSGAPAGHRSWASEANCGTELPSCVLLLVEHVGSGGCFPVGTRAFYSDPHRFPVPAYHDVTHRYLFAVLAVAVVSNVGADDF